MSNNFLQWNPGAVNQENDGTYAADALRSGGAPANAIFPSALANKVFYQSSIFVAAFAQMMSDKGYNLSDVDFNTLKTVLANVITGADFGSFSIVRNIFSDLSSHSHTGSVTRIDLISTIIPANTLTAGHSFRITISGLISSQGATPSALILNFGGVFPGQINFSFNSGDSNNNGQFFIQAIIPYSGLNSQIAGGFKICQTGTQELGTNITDMHVNPTLPQPLSLQVQSGAASDFQQIRSFIVELV